MANEITATNNLGNTTSQVAKIATIDMARSMVMKYAQDQLGKERAKEYFMHLGFLMRTNPKIAQCTPESIFKAMMECVRLDLMPNTPEQYCALIPYGHELQMQPMYKGGIELAYRSGLVRTIKAENVFPEDFFEADDAMNTISHRKNLTINRTIAKNIVATYAVAKLENGEVMFEVMSPSEIKKIKDKAVKAKGSGTPWSEWEERMVRKSPLKRLFNVLPNSSKDNRFKQWAHLDDLKEAGKHVEVDIKTGEFIEGDSLAGERANENEKAAIIAAHKEVDNAADTAEREPEQPEATDTEPSISDQATTQGEPRKETVKEKAERKYGPKKQAALIDEPGQETSKDDNGPRSNPGER